MVVPLAKVLSLPGESPCILLDASVCELFVVFSVQSSFFFSLLLSFSPTHPAFSLQSPIPLKDKKHRTHFKAHNDIIRRYFLLEAITNSVWNPGNLENLQHTWSLNCYT